MINDLAKDLVAASLAIIRSDTPNGFSGFYTLVHNRGLPDHAREWVNRAYYAYSIGKPYLNEAFRGSTKTTTFNTLDAYRLGLHPEKSAMLIQSGDESAERNSGEIANIIEHNPAWKICFPNVVPDKEQGWGASGYEIKRTDMDYGEWRRLRSPDASLVGFGYKSNSIIGKHPSLSLRIDDIHNEENTSSEREMEKVLQTVTNTIMPTRSPNNPMTIIIGTPWVENDTLQKMKASGMFVCDKTPVYQPGKVPTWPEEFGEEKIEMERKLDLTGGIAFARMFLLDLTAAHNRVFQYQMYPSHLIDTTWPMQGGTDYASVADAMKRGERGQSHFALAYLAKLPAGGAVVVDGVLEQCSQGEAEDYLLRAQNMFPMWLSNVVEGDGKGEDFIQVMFRHPEMRIVPMKTAGVSKVSRLAGPGGLAPWLRNMRIRISDGNSKFLNALRHFLNAYPNVQEHDPGWDAADAVYWAARGLPDVLVMPTPHDELASVYGRKRVENPFASLGSH